VSQRAWCKRDRPVRVGGGWGEGGREGGKVRGRVRARARAREREKERERERERGTAKRESERKRESESKRASEKETLMWRKRSPRLPVAARVLPFALLESSLLSIPLPPVYRPHTVSVHPYTHTHTHSHSDTHTHTHTHTPIRMVASIGVTWCSPLSFVCV
jgi:ABC-type nickel/cobalt efflux system permease component RcnA